MNINELEELAKAAPAAFYLDSDDGLDREFNGIDSFSCGRNGGVPLYAFDQSEMRDSIPKKQAKDRRRNDCEAIKGAHTSTKINKTTARRRASIGDLPMFCRRIFPPSPRQPVTAPTSTGGDHAEASHIV